MHGVFTFRGYFIWVNGYFMAVFGFFCKVAHFSPFRLLMMHVQ